MRAWTWRARLTSFQEGSHHHLARSLQRLQDERGTYENEEEQLRTIEILLLRYQEERVSVSTMFCRTETMMCNDAVEVRDDEQNSLQDRSPPIGLMSQTNTHYQFNSPAPAGLDVRSSTGDPAGGAEEQDLGFGLGVGTVDPAFLRSLDHLAQESLARTNPSS